jgi:ubiquinone/menaquinone biosynthesis C-methylase UbiE
VTPDGDDASRPHHRDVAAFEARATTYEDGWRGRMHRDIADRTGTLAASNGGSARVLDVGCGTGLVLRAVAARLPGAEVLTGVDAAPAMIEVARAAGDSGDGSRLSFEQGMAEQLPFPDGSFDLVVSAVSFHHWHDQAAGLAECHRVLAPGGRLVLTDLLWLGLVPALFRGRHHRHRARTRGNVEQLLRGAGFAARPQWHRLYALVISTAVVAR